LGLANDFRAFGSPRQLFYRACYAVLIHALETKQGSFVSSFLQYCF